MQSWADPEGRGGGGQGVLTPPGKSHVATVMFP